MPTGVERSGRIRVVFIVSVPQHGLGGHYHSLAAIAGTLIDRQAVDASVISVGRRRAAAVDALEADGVKVTHIHYSGANTIAVARAVLRECRSFAPDVLHAFDEHAFLFARFAAWKIGAGTVLTKCGGPPPAGFFPQATALTVFSKQDEEWFIGRSCPRVFLLPNRVRSVPQDQQLIAELARMSPARTRILRVSRIATHYEKTMTDSIRLISRLRASGFDARLMIVGRVYDVAVYRRLKELGQDNVVWVTDDRFTRDTKRIIDVADIVVGTGRSLMEAVARGRTVLCPAAGLSIPCLVTPVNVEELAKYNFSERGRLETNDDEQFEALCERLRSGQTQDEAQFLKDLSARFCAIDSAIAKYQELYALQADQPEALSIDAFIHALKVQFVFLRQRWRESRFRAA